MTNQPTPVRTIDVTIRLQLPAYFKADAESAGRNAAHLLDALYSDRYEDEKTGYIHWARFVQAEEGSQ